MNRTQFILSLRSLIEYHKLCGLDGYHLDSEVLRTLDTFRSTHVAEMKNAEQDPVQELGSDRRKARIDEKQGIRVSVDTPAVSADIEICTKCPLHKKRQRSIVGKGGVRPLLLIIGDWLFVPEGYSPAAGEIFGRDQDDMLARMIKAIKLNEQDVFITNAIKCSLPASCQPTSEHIRTCEQYLLQQIDTLKPWLICTMGIIASRLLTGRSQPLSQQRGRFVLYKTQSGREIPVMPTYHPTFLLKNPEMKAATWTDLQEIEKKLGELGKRNLNEVR